LSKINQFDNGYLFYQVPKILLEHEDYRQCLDSIDILVYSLLMDRWNQFVNKVNSDYIDKSGEMYIVYSEKDLAQILNKNRRFISESISKLKNIGLIRVEKRKKYPEQKLNREMINRYYLYDIPREINFENQIEIDKIKQSKNESKQKNKKSAKLRESKKKRLKN
jgi:predicted transcriptional regulator